MTTAERAPSAAAGFAWAPHPAARPWRRQRTPGRPAAAVATMPWPSSLPDRP
ncbi:hypothetical protein QJS66_19550 [Kocuria rhizophila]|nr:hypothetical protein QJS66_19550 [Kocuria rhizophila]